MTSNHWTSMIGFGTVLPYILGRFAEPEPQRTVPSAPASFGKPVALLAPKERAAVKRYRVEIMAEHGQWQRRKHEQLCRRAGR